MSRKIMKYPWGKTLVTGVISTSLLCGSGLFLQTNMEDVKELSKEEEIKDDVVGEIETKQSYNGVQTSVSTHDL